jgi:hypothetical protein
MARSSVVAPRGQGAASVIDNVEGRWDDRRVLVRRGEHRGGTVVVEPSRGAVVELGGGAQTERQGRVTSVIT